MIYDIASAEVRLSGEHLDVKIFMDSQSVLSELFLFFIPYKGGFLKIKRDSWKRDTNFIQMVQFQFKVILKNKKLYIWLLFSNNNVGLI